jgi:subtilisin family serine protease
MSDRTPLRKMNPNLGAFVVLPRTQEFTESDKVLAVANEFATFVSAKRVGGQVIRAVTSKPAKGRATFAPTHLVVFGRLSSFYVPPEINAAVEWSEFATAHPQYSSAIVEPDTEFYALGRFVIDGRPASTDVSTAIAHRTAPRGMLTTSQVRVYWHIPLVMGEPLWPSGGGQNTSVAVLDTGIDHNNPLLMENYIGGESFVSGASSTHDDHGHGTHVAGLIGCRPGTYEDGLDLYWSIAPYCYLGIAKVLGSNGSGSGASVIAALEWARDQNAGIVSMSLGSVNDPGETYHRAIQDCAERCVIVAAAGNSGPNANTVNWPARFRETIGVGAVNRDCNIAEFSSRGPADPNAFVEDNVEIVAPGVDVWSNKLGGGQQELIKMSGTSMATPIASGIMALFQQKHREVEGGTESWRYLIRNSVLDLGIGGPDNWYGLGLTRILSDS